VPPHLFANLSPQVRTLAEAIADGAAVDWTALEAQAGEGDRPLIRGLRAISRVTAVRTSADSDVRSDDASEAAPFASLPARWGVLHVLEHVGNGRFGDVYRAWDPVLDRDVALKLIRRRVAGRDEGFDVNEARLMARVRHPNVITIHGADRIEGQFGLWMEFIRGRTLDAELRERGPFDGAALVRVGIELARALAAVHAAGLVHRDVKAQNVLRDESGRIVLGDFGTGRALADDSAATMAGTPAYLAPEIFHGATATRQSDIYSLGALLFYLATARYPVQGRTVTELRTAHAHAARVSLSALRPDLPARLADTIDVALRVEPDARYRDAAALESALVHVPATLASARWQPEPIVVAAALTALLAASAVIFWRASPDSTIPGAEAAVAPIVDRPGAPAAPPLILPAAPPPGETTHAVSAGGTVTLGSVAIAGGGQPGPVAPSRGVTLTHVNPELQSRVLIQFASADRDLVTCNVIGRQGIGVCNLATGDVRELRLATIAGAVSGRLSPDLRRIAYWWNGKDGPAVRVMHADGSHDAEVLPAAANVNVLNLHWVDGDRLAVLLRDQSPDNRSLRYDIVPAGGGAPALLWMFDALPDGGSIDVSADGRFIVYDHPGPGGDRDIVLVDVARQRQGRLTTQSSNDVRPLWTPDGTSVLFASDGRGVRGLYTVAVADGVAVGEPTLVRDISRGTMTPLGFSRDGTLLIRRVPHWYNVFRAPVSLDAGTVDEPRWLDPRAGDVETPGVASSPDGTRIAYVAGNLDDPTSSPSRVVILRQDGSLDRELPMVGVVVRKSRVRWSADGTRLAVLGELDRDAMIEVFDVASGRSEQIIAASGAWDLSWDPFGDAIYYATAQEVRRYDLATKAAVATYQPATGLSTAGTFDVSPIDGSLLLPVSIGGAGAIVRVVRPDGREINRPVAGTLVALAWTRDGQRIVVSQIRDPRRATLMVLDAAAGPPREVQVRAEPIVDISFGPGDGEMFFAAGNGRPEFWTLSNFLPSR
jgi:serine/threonine-protein kinase